MWLRHMRSLPLALGLALLLSRTAWADDTEPKIDCDNASSTVEMNYCGEQAYMKADAELNRVYQQIVKSVDSQDDGSGEGGKSWKESLKSAQKAWIDFKEKDCGELIYLEWYGGTGAASASYGCLIQKTETRIKELKERYEVQ